MDDREPDKFVDVENVVFCWPQGVSSGQAANRGFPDVHAWGNEEQKNNLVGKFYG
jgi:hypothetical protein